MMYEEYGNEGKERSRIIKIGTGKDKKKLEDPTLLNNAFRLCAITIVFDCTTHHGEKELNKYFSLEIFLPLYNCTHVDTLACVHVEKSVLRNWI